MRPISPSREDLGQGGIGDAGGRPDALDLRRLLDRSQALDEAAGRDQRDALGQPFTQPRVPADGEVGVIEAEPQLPAGQQLLEAVEEIAGAVVAPPVKAGSTSAAAWAT